VEDAGGQPVEAARRTPMSVLIAAFKQLRPKQWVKNILLFAALVFSGELFEPGSVLRAVLGFVAFGLLASSGYVFNDYLDREADRRHPKKRFRPIASGALPVPAALAVMAIVLVAGVLLSLWLGPWFLAVGLAYLVTTLSYSFYFKHLVILDVMFLSLCYVWRVVGGALAIQVQVSAWLLLCTAFLSLFLGFNKRRAELVALGDSAGTRKNLVQYSSRMLEEFQSIVTAGTVVSYCMYAVMGPSQWMGLTIPFVLYGVLRYIYLVDQRGEGGAPDETLLRDRPILIAGVLYGLTAVGVMYAERAGWLSNTLAAAAAP
jgi:4-hydroxybenzoate polyprenyltransferase